MSDERARRLGLAVLALILAAIAVAANPLNVPQSWLEWWLERRLPDGSSIVTVRNLVEREQWQTVDEWQTGGGFLVQVFLGREWYPRRRYVYAFFSFDAFGQLRSVAVRKGETPTSVSGVVLPR